MAFLEDPRLRQRWNQIAHDAETVTENAAAGIWSFQHHYITPCLSSVAASVEAERKVQELQHALVTTSQRADLAEQAMRRDREALAALQDRVVATFGLGSEAHEALATLDFD